MTKIKKCLRNTALISVGLLAFFVGSGITYSAGSYTINVVRSIAAVFVTTVFSSTYDIATPAGVDDPSEADDRMREIKAAIQERLNVSMYFPLTGTEVSDADAGEMRMIPFHESISDPTQVASHSHLYMQSDELRYQDDTNSAFDLTSGGNLGSASTNLLANTAIFSGTLDVTGNIDPTTYETTNGGFLDEDDMASDAADKVASQQSVKKYVDDQILAEVPLDIRIKGWINFNGTGTIAERDSFNVTAITDNGTGDYTISWDTDFANANHCVIPSTNQRDARINAQSAGSIRINTYDSLGNLADASIICVMAIGDQ